MQANTQDGRNNLRYQSNRLRRDAPKDFDLEFLTEYSDANSNVTIGYELTPIMNDDSLNDEEFSKWLATKASFDFGVENDEMQVGATCLGALAKSNPELVLKWADSAPHLVYKILAKLCIAPAVEKKDRTVAIELVR